MRVYIPSTLPGLARAVAVHELGPPPLAAYAVTPGLRKAYGTDDPEELEYAAMEAAADESLSLLAADAAAPRLRVVLAADVPEETTRQGSHLETGQLLLDRPVPVPKIASAHVDERDAAGAVARAVDALPLAEQGEDAARDIVDEARDRELLWYARQEVPDLVDDLSPDSEVQERTTGRSEA